jgi:hypothetical protein
MIIGGQRNDGVMLEQVLADIRAPPWVQDYRAPDRMPWWPIGPTRRESTGGCWPARGSHRHPAEEG